MSLLAETLRFAIPMWRLEMERWGREELLAMMPEFAQTIAEKGDALMFKCKGTKDAFNALAKGMAGLEILAPEGWDTEAMLERLSRNEAAFFGDR